jgi:hypothetical protein
MVSKEESEDRLLNILLRILEKANIDLENADEIIKKVIPDTLPEIADVILKELKSSAPKMLKNRRKIASGFESRLRKVWGKSFDLLEMLIVIALEVGEEFNKQFRPAAAKNNDYVFDALTRLHARGCQTSLEILTLLKSGYADGAHARWRTLHEIAVTAFFITDHGNDVAERYILHEIIESHNAMRQYQEYCKELNAEPFDEDEISRLTSAKDNLVKRFGINFSNRYGWASEALGKKNPSFSDIEKEANIEHLRPYYKMSSYNVHATSKGIKFKLGLSPNVNFLLAGPSNAGLADPGHSTAISLNQITVALLKTRVNFDRLAILQIMTKLEDEIGSAFISAHDYVEKQTLLNLSSQKQGV